MGDGGGGSSGGGIREFGSLGGGFWPGEPIPESGAGAGGSPGAGVGPGARLFESTVALVVFVSALCEVTVFVSGVAVAGGVPFVPTGTGVGVFDDTSGPGVVSAGGGTGFS